MVQANTRSVSGARTKRATTAVAVSRANTSSMARVSGRTRRTSRRVIAGEVASTRALPLVVPRAADRAEPANTRPQRAVTGVGSRSTAPSAEVLRRERPRLHQHQPVAGVVPQHGLHAVGSLCRLLQELPSFPGGNLVTQVGGKDRGRAPD